MLGSRPISLSLPWHIVLYYPRCATHRKLVFCVLASIPVVVQKPNQRIAYAMQSRRAE